MSSNSQTTTNVAIIGGGPVGLSTASLLLEYGHRRNVRFQITIYEPRWKLADNGSGRTEWTGQMEMNHRRCQVVTLQSQVWSLLPPHVQRTLFNNENEYCEMWPLGPDSPKEVGFPRNIPLLHIENKLLALLQSDDLRDLKPILRARRVEQEDFDGIDFVVLADGPRRQTEHKFFSDVFGDFVPFPGFDDPPVENVLGIFVQDDSSDDANAIGVTEADGMLMTVSQNRFLLNPLGRKRGFLNMWLSDEEADEAIGVDKSFRPVQCIQSKPCVMHLCADGNFRCKTHGSVFFPATTFARESLNHKLWPRIQEGLKLYGIREENVKLLTKFQLGPFRQRTTFLAQSGAGKDTRRPQMVFPIGDAAFNVSFRAGRGLNTGLKAAVALSRALTRAAERGSWRDSDFNQHAGFMYSLQQREVRSRSLDMMVVPRDDGTGDVVVKDLLHEAYETPVRPDEVFQFQQEFMDRLTSTAQAAFNKTRLPPQIAPPNLDRLKHNISNSAFNTLIPALTRSQNWNVYPVGGREVAVDDYVKEPDWLATSGYNQEQGRVAAGRAAVPDHQPAHQQQQRRVRVENRVDVRNVQHPPLPPSEPVYEYGKFHDPNSNDEANHNPAAATNSRPRDRGGAVRQDRAAVDNNGNNSDNGQRRSQARDPSGIWFQVEDKSVPPPTTTTAKAGTRAYGYL